MQTPVPRTLHYPMAQVQRNVSCLQVRSVSILEWRGIISLIRLGCGHRHQLVPQPEHHGPPGTTPSGSSGGGNGGGSGRRSQSPSGGAGGGGLFGNLFNILGGAVAGPSNTSPNPNSASSGGTSSGRNSMDNQRAPNSRRGSYDNHRGRNGRRGSRQGSNEHHDLPGAWNDVD